MARIPDVTSLGARPVARASRSIVSDNSGQISSRAIGQLGEVVQDIGEQRFAQQRQLAQAQANNAALDYEISARSLVDDIGRRVGTGELPYSQAESEFSDKLSKVQLPTIDHIDPLHQSALEQHTKRVNAAATEQLKGVVFSAEKKDFGEQAGAALDKLGKLAGLPGANIDDINARADLNGDIMRRAGLSQAQVGKVLQDFKDKNWLNQATQRAMESATSLPALKQLRHDLTASDGFYAGKLDTDRRNAVLRSVLADEEQLKNRALHESDRIEMRAERAILQIDQQIASGVPATPQQWATWETVIRGTSQGDEFKARLKDEQDVQTMLRKPIGDQLAYVQQKQAQLEQGGGSLRDQANFARLSRAVGANVKQLQTAPLLFNQSRTGAEVAPLDLAQLGDEDSAAELGHQIRERMSDLASMRKEYGASVPFKPLLPQEAQQLSAALDKAGPEDQAQLFATLHHAIGDMDAFKGVMQQIAPDAPVKALAGMLAAKDADYTTATHWFRPNDTLNSRKVAATMLEGERLLDATKAQKAEDGKPKVGLYLPKDADLQASFADAVGTAFANRTDAAQSAYQAVKAYYTGRAVQTGRLASDKSDIDADLVKESVQAVVGSPVDFNGHGQVLAPWGMDEDTFEERAQSALAGELKRRGMSQDLSDNFGLRNLGDGTYYVTAGRGFLTDSAGHGVVIKVTP